MIDPASLGEFEQLVLIRMLILKHVFDWSYDDLNHMKQESEHPLDGPHKELFADGKLSGEGRFKNCKRHGNGSSSTGMGQKRPSASIQAGRWMANGNGGEKMANGFRQEPSKTEYRLAIGVGNYENGQLWDEGLYEDGKKAGEWTTYDNSGAVKQHKVHKSKRSTAT